MECDRYRKYFCDDIHRISQYDLFWNVSLTRILYQND